MKPKLGFIGLGIMGKPMVRKLIAAGYTVHVYSIVAADVEEAARGGAIAEANGLEVAKKADVTITMVPNTPDVEEVLFGDNGLIGVMGQGKTLIDMSTISALATKAFAKKIKATGAQMLDAPVSGGEKGAIEGNLSIMVGGDEAVFKACKPILEVMGGRITHVGGNGAGQTVKSCNQVLAAATMAAIGEALAMGTKAGVDPARIVEVLSAGYARCGCLDIRGQQILKRDFNPGFKSKLQYKDLNLAMELARGIDVPMPIGSLVTEFYKSCMAAGGGDEDHSNVIKIAEQLAHVEIKAWQASST
ncbi:MAG: NAD(P)-dependent oxidoreductase [Candidatus Accumulibacter sp.]|jgi:2-hydroxy-3-oxopropionate reductase|nr:NAD(P)-dependent oxidoreductase [Accumulibacter sp.]